MVLHHLLRWGLFSFRIKNTPKHRNSAAQFFDDKIKWNFCLRFTLYAAWYVWPTSDLHFNYLTVILVESQWRRWSVMSCLRVVEFCSIVVVDFISSSSFAVTAIILVSSYKLFWHFLHTVLDRRYTHTRNTVLGRNLDYFSLVELGVVRPQLLHWVKYLSLKPKVLDAMAWARWITSVFSGPRSFELKSKSGWQKKLRWALLFMRGREVIVDGLLQCSHELMLLILCPLLPWH